MGHFSNLLCSILLFFFICYSSYKNAYYLCLSQYSLYISAFFPNLNRSIFEFADHLSLAIFIYDQKRKICQNITGIHIYCRFSVITFNISYTGRSVAAFKWAVGRCLLGEMSCGDVVVGQNELWGRCLWIIFCKK